MRLVILAMSWRWWGWGKTSFQLVLQQLAQQHGPPLLGGLLTGQGDGQRAQGVIKIAQNACLLASPHAVNKGFVHEQVVFFCYCY